MPAETSSLQRPFRVVHITDMHMKHDLDAARKIRACMEQIYSLSTPPDLILNGGDMVFDSLATEWYWVSQWWNLWTEVMKDFTKIPMEHCIGNHDIWGIHQKECKSIGNEPYYGKKAVMGKCGLESRYRSFNQGGWHFIILDSSLPQDGYGYTACLDDEQWKWLQTDIAAVSPTTPILTLSHIPLLCACAFLDGDNEKSGNWTVPGAWMHLDIRRIKNLFYHYPNVKLSLSGHIHLYDRVQYNGVTYICNGAVCGNWWKGSYQETPPGFGVVDLYPDGSFQDWYIPLRNEMD